MPDRHVETHTLLWNGIRIEIRYCPSWSESYECVYGHPLAHLEIETIDPARTPLPVTQTGYRSHTTASRASGPPKQAMGQLQGKKTGRPRLRAAGSRARVNRTPAAPVGAAFIRIRSSERPKPLRRSCQNPARGP